MKICIIGKYPPIQGGVSMRTYWTAHRLAQRGHHVHVMTNAKEVSPPFRMHMRPQDWLRCELRLRKGSVTVHWTDPVDRSQFHIPMASPFVSKLAALAVRAHAEHGFDVIYSHYMEPYGVAGHFAAQMTSVPHVARMAGSDAGRLWRHPQFEPIFDHVLRSAEVLIAAGSVAVRAVKHGVDPHRIASGGGYSVPEELFTSHGRTLDVGTLRAEVAREDTLADAVWGEFSMPRPHFGVYGKLGDNKGSFALLSALHRLKRSGRDIGLIAIAHGRADVEQKFRHHARELGLAGDILQLPFVPHWRIPEFLRGCLAVCCLEQNFPIEIHTPIVPREVLLCGRCLVASTELLEKLPNSDRLPSGYGCVAVKDVDDIDTLAERLGAIADDPEPAAAVGRRGRDFARELQRDVDFPAALEHVLLAAAARAPLQPVPSGRRNRPPEVLIEHPFHLARLAADALNRDGAAFGSRTKLRIPNSLVLARRVHTALERAIARGAVDMKPLLPAVTIEIAVAAAETATPEPDVVAAADPLFRVRTQRWALGAYDLASLVPLRSPQVHLLTFDVDVALYVGIRELADLPSCTRPHPSHLVAFTRGDREQRSPLLLDHTSARILQFCDGTKTALAIAKLTRPTTSTTAQTLAWIENLFCLGLISLGDPGHPAHGHARYHSAAVPL